NPNPPRLRLLPQVIWPVDEQPVGLACLDSDQIVVMSWTDGGDACLRRLVTAPGEPILGRRVVLEGAVFPYSVAGVGTGKLAVRSLGLEAGPTAGLEREALVYALPELEATARPVGDLYPLQKAVAGPFAHTVDLPPHYPTATGTAPLYPVS